MGEKFNPSGAETNQQNVSSLDIHKNPDVERMINENEQLLVLSEIREQVAKINLRTAFLEASIKDVEENPERYEEVLEKYAINALLDSTSSSPETPEPVIDITEQQPEQGNN